MLNQLNRSKPWSRIEVLSRRARELRLGSRAKRRRKNQHRRRSDKSQEIAEAATLNRGMFYAHFTDKFALLDEWIRLSFLEHLGQRNVSFDGSCSSAFRTMFLALCDFLAEMQKMRSSQQRQFEPSVEAAIVGLLQKILLGGFKKHRADRAVSEELAAAAASSTTPDRAPAEKFVNSAVTLVRPILAGGTPPEAPVVANPSSVDA